MNLHILAITHRNFDFAEIGRFHLADERRPEVLGRVKSACDLGELMYLSTCNRVEFIFTKEEEPGADFLRRFFSAFDFNDEALLAKAIVAAEKFSGETALRHLFNVASSLDSLVVGEREIITQVRNAYEESKKSELTGDTLRLVIKKTIETAKKIYTQTDIARNPVSVVSLAYRKLRELNVPVNAKFIIVGSGVTNTAMARYLKKHGFQDFVVFNRTVANAQKLAAELEANAFPLAELSSYKNGFDVIVTCTGAEHAVITPEIYHSLTGGDHSRKIVIDLAVPNDLDASIPEQWDVNLIAVNNLQEIASENLRQRENELDACAKIISEGIAEFRGEYRERQVEIAMAAVPEKVKEIRHQAVNAVFAKEISGLDKESKEVLERVLSYMEKKYISVPMKMAREILTDEARGE